MFYETVYGVYELHISSSLEKYKNRSYSFFIYIAQKIMLRFYDFITYHFNFYTKKFLRFFIPLQMSSPNLLPPSTFVIIKFLQITTRIFSKFTDFVLLTRWLRRYGPYLIYNSTKLFSGGVENLLFLVRKRRRP